MHPLQTTESMLGESIWRMLDPPITPEQEPRVRRQLLLLLAIGFVVGLVMAALRVSAFRSIGSYPDAAIGVDIVWGLSYVALAVVALMRSGGVLLLRVSILMTLVEASFGAVRLVFGFDPRGGSFLVGVLVAHAGGAILLPWTPLRTVLPAAGALVIACLAIIAEAPLGLGKAGFILVGAGMCLPGIVISVVRNWREQSREMVEYFRHRYHQMRQELVDARLIHEAAFPPPRETGSVRLAFVYEPMSQIGGDYLHAHISPGQRGGDEALSAAVLDVTGHGIPAALTVNRLHGELTRLYAENTHMGPGAILAALNRYVYLTLADHSVFVTGIVMRVDPTTSTLEFASAGHPPAFLRSSSGQIEELHATAIVLGALPDIEFDPNPQRRRFMPGDSIIAYTDGATDVSSRTGQRLEVAGLRQIIAQGWADQTQRWPATIMRAVSRFKSGPQNDDILVIELYRTLGEEAHGPVGEAQSEPGHLNRDPHPEQAGASLRESS